jgi:hypothetical protein
MQFFVLLGIRSESASREVLKPGLISQEIQAVKGLLRSGKARQAWKREDCPCVLLFVDAFDEQECRGVLAALPFARAGILEIQMLAPVEPYTEVFSGTSGD